MEGMAALVGDIVSATVGGLLVLLAERILSHRAARKGGGGDGTPRGALVNHLQGVGGVAVLQQGDGNTTHIDQSRHVVKVQSGGGSHAPARPSDPDEPWLWVFGALLGVALIVLTFVQIESGLRVAYMGLWGATFAAGAATLVLGLRAGWGVERLAAAVVPGAIACAVGGYAWGRWTGSWGTPLPQLQELLEAVKTLPTNSEAPLLDGLAQGVAGTARLLMTSSPSLMPGVISLISVLAHLGILAAGLWVGSRALAAAVIHGQASPSMRMVQLAASFVDHPWRAGGGPAFSFLLIGGVMWVLTQPWLLGRVGG